MGVLCHAGAGQYRLSRQCAPQPFPSGDGYPQNYAHGGVEADHERTLFKGTLAQLDHAPDELRAAWLAADLTEAEYRIMVIDSVQDGVQTTEQVLFFTLV